MAIFTRLISMRLTLMFAAARARLAVSHMNTRSLIIIALALLLTSWAALVLSGINADYLLDVNASKMAGQQPQSWRSFIVENNRLLKGLVFIELELWPLYALFWAPLIGILLARKSKHVQYLIFLLIIILLLLDLRQFFMFEGGDRKGCESCFVWWVVHSAGGAVTIVVGGFAGLWRCVRQARRVTTCTNKNG